MTKRWFEVFVGICIIWLCVAFVAVAYKSTVGSFSSREVTENLRARFFNIEGVFVGTDVKIGGIKVGMVRELSLDENLMVNVVVGVKKDIKIPSDSNLVVTSSGLLGNKYLEIKIGSEEELLKDGDYFANTRSVISVEELIGKFAFKK